jgi:hypothetical protein
MSPKPPRPVPGTQGEASLLKEIDKHAGDKTNPHGVKLSQLADLTNATSGATGTVPMKQADGTYLLTAPPGASGGAPVGTATPLGQSGTGAAGSSTNAAREDHVHPTGIIMPEDYGFTAWTMDPMLGTATGAYTAGTIIFARVKMPKTSAISTVVLPLTTAGTGITNGWVGVYSLAGNQLAVSADQGTAWGTAGTKTIALSAATASQPAGTTVLVAVLALGTTGPSGRFAAAAATQNQNITAAQGYRAGSWAGQTTLPATLTLGSTTAGNSLPLIFLS